MTANKYRYLFGPVHSRRLGFSLGLDVTPMKTCTFNCIYCQLGRTTHQTIERREYVPAAEVMAELADYVANEGQADFLTFSGSGEPTLHSKLGEMIAQAKRMSTIPVAVLTCGALLHDPQVRRELACADVVLPSLNAVSPGTFSAINRPHGQLSVAEVVAGLKRFREEFAGRIWLEIMLVKGVNDGAEEIALLREALVEIKPDKVHLNTVIRPPAENTAGALSEVELQAVQISLGFPTEVIAQSSCAATSTLKNPSRSEALSLIARHPATLEEISQYMKCEAGRVEHLLNVLLESGEAKKRLHRGKLFYATAGNRAFDRAQNDFRPRLVGFLCKTGAHVFCDIARSARRTLPANFTGLAVASISQVQTREVLKALLAGADGVLIAGCEVCHSPQNLRVIERQLREIKQALARFGIDSNRIDLQWISATEEEKFIRAVQMMMARLEQLPRLRLPAGLEKDVAHCG